MIKLPVVMYNCFSKIVLVFIVCFFVQVTKAQLLDSLTLDTMQGHTSLQEAMKNPDAVIKLVLRKQKLKSFPREILLFKNLQYLDISKNSIKELSDSIGLLTNLQYFACSKTGLERVPKQIGKLKNLKYLNFNQNDLEYLPPQIGDLENLENLDLWSNNFNEYPATFVNLKSLQVLDLRNILMSDEVQSTIINQLPKAKVYLSPTCKCKW